MYDESSSGSDETDGSSGAADAKLVPSGGDLEAHRGFTGPEVLIVVQRVNKFGLIRIL